MLDMKPVIDSSPCRTQALLLPLTRFRQGELLLKFVRFGELGVLVLVVKTLLSSNSVVNRGLSSNRVVNHLTKTPSITKGRKTE